MISRHDITSDLGGEDSEGTILISGYVVRVKLKEAVLTTDRVRHDVVEFENTNKYVMVETPPDRRLHMEYIVLDVQQIDSNAAATIRNTVDAVAPRAIRLEE